MNQRKPGAYFRLSNPRFGAATQPPGEDDFDVIVETGDAPEIFEETGTAGLIIIEGARPGPAPMVLITEDGREITTEDGLSLILEGWL